MTVSRAEQRGGEPWSQPNSETKLFFFFVYPELLTTSQNPHGFKRSCFLDSRYVTVKFPNFAT